MLPDPETPWLLIARKELGTHEIRGGENPRILEYHATTTLKATEDEVPWCSAFVTWCLEQAGYKSTKSAAAKSYLDYGDELKHPRPGCIVVFSRGAGLFHVAFFEKEDPYSVLALGGNQSDKVCVQSYPKSRVLEYRWPVKA